MGRLRTAKTSLVVTVLLAMGTTTVTSQHVDGPPTTSVVLERLYGTYRYAGDPAAAHATIQKSIETAVSSLGWLGRKIAASRLANHKELPDRIEIKRIGDDVSVEMGQYFTSSSYSNTPSESRRIVATNWVSSSCRS